MLKSHTVSEILDLLLELAREEKRVATLSSRTDAYKNSTKRIAVIRGEIPPQMLGHHDRKRARGRVSVALVTNWVCGNCHLTIPTGNRAALMKSSDLHICDNCGTFIKLAAESVPDIIVAEPVLEKKSKIKAPAKSPRKTVPKKAKSAPKIKAAIKLPSTRSVKAKKAISKTSPRKR